jgi:hypothetical protein
VRAEGEGDTDGLLAQDASLGAQPVAPASVYRGSLKEGAIDATLRVNAFRFRGCGLSGSAVVRVIVRGDGKVETATLFRDHLTAGGPCLLEALRGVPFPAPTGGDAEVLIPFVFRPKAATP